MLGEKHSLGFASLQGVKGERGFTGPTGDKGDEVGEKVETKQMNPVVIDSKTPQGRCLKTMKVYVCLDCKPVYSESLFSKEAIKSRPRCHLCSVP